MDNENNEFIIVEPSDRLFEELGKNTYNYVDLLSELIDNSIAARVNNKPVDVDISIFKNDNNDPIRIVIVDNASGISLEDLSDAISPAAMGKDASLNEHGLGMKQAIAGLGELDYLKTKVLGQEHALVVRDFKFGKIPVEKSSFENPSGTEISIINAKPIVVTNTSSITRDIIDKLGARYRRFLQPDNKKLFLKIFLLDETGEIQYEWDIRQVKPLYFHPSTRNNQPIIDKYLLDGKHWKAKLTFGYAPTDNDCEELGIPIPTKYHPYNVSLSKQGLDIIRFDRVILFHQLSELGIVPGRHNSYNLIRGEIDLVEGFTTAITKNSIIYDKNFRECVERITGILTGQIEGPKDEIRDYLKIKTFPDQIPEKLLRDRLKIWLKNNPLQSKQQVNSEFSLEGIGGYVDIVADNECWEIKVEKADALCVYQLFMYLDIGDFQKGYLVSNGHTTGAEIAVNHIEEKYNKKIILADLSDFPITNPPDENERKEYY